MLLAEAKGKIQKLLVVEPAEGMRQGFMDKLAGSGVEPAQTGIEVDVLDGTFTSIPADAGTIDLVSVFYPGQVGGDADRDPGCRRASLPLVQRRRRSHQGDCEGSQARRKGSSNPQLN